MNLKCFHSQWIQETLGLTSQGPFQPAHVFGTITTDSRKIQPGCLFTALKGERFDGHDFIAQAISQGAQGILCHKNRVQKDFGDSIHWFPVKNTEVAFRTLASAWRRLFQIPIIVVAGSVGKTTTKEFLAAILQGKWTHVLKTLRSQNGFLGIPMTLLELRSEHQAAVVEVGIDEVGAMQQHMQLVQPTAALLTAIGPEHLEKLQDLSTIAREEGIALQHVARTGGVIAINYDDPWIRSLDQSLSSDRKVGFSLGGKISQSPVEEILLGQISPDHKQILCNGLGINGLALSLPLPGKHNASNLLGAVALAHALGLTAQEIQKGLSTVQGLEGRSVIHSLDHDISVIGDYYNANPSSMKAGIDLLTQFHQEKPRQGKRWACLADMLELGAQEEALHRGVAQELLDQQMEHILLYGPRMEVLYSELKSRGFQGTLEHFHSHTDLAQSLLHQVSPGDTILIKGSRGMKMEEVWKIIQCQLKSLNPLQKI